MFDKLFSSITPLQMGLDASALRGRVIQNNIANAETPNFKSSSVEFESIFSQALQSQLKGGNKMTSPKHIKFSSTDTGLARVYKNTGTTARMDGNNVDIDYENAELAKNSIYYNTLVQKLNSEFSRLRMAIKE